MIGNDMIKIAVHAALFLFLFCISRIQAAEMSNADSLLKAQRHFSFAVQYKKSEEYDLAFDQYEKSIAFNDTVYQVHYSFADLLMKMDRSQDAKIQYLRSLSLNPKHYNSALMLAKLYYEYADYDSTLKMHEILYDLKPDNYGVLESIANIREHLGMKEKALDAYEKLIENGRNSHGNLMRAGKLAISLGEYENAINYVNSALMERPEDMDALSMAAELNLLLENYKTSGKHLHQMAVIDSTDVSILTRLEKIYRLSGDTENLIWTLERYHKLSPDNTVIIGELSELLYNNDMIVRGVEYVKTGLELSPEDGKLRILMGEYYLNRGMDKEALNEFKIALNDEKWHSSAQQLIWKIEKPESESEKAEKEFFKRGRKHGRNK